MYRQGDVVLVSFPFTDLTSTKRRPAVVVSPDTFNARNEDVVLVAVTSQITREVATVLLRQRDVVDGVLPKESVARLAKLFTLHSSLVVKRLCRLKSEKRDELLRGLRSFFQ
jgi:mRNA interferase MazF